MKLLYLLTLYFGALASSIAQTTAISGHSHNDYAQKHPFTTAFNAKMGSIEADVYFVNHQLYVAHDAKDIQSERTLDRLYLRPLAKRVRKHQVYPLILLIDIKSAADSTLDAIVAQITHYKVFSTTHFVQFVISGNRPRPEKWSNYPSFILFDGRPYETYTSEQWQRVGLVSDNFSRYADAATSNSINSTTFDKMKAMVDGVHAKGKKVRFWATPDTDTVWKNLVNLNVDFINTDSPEALSKFLKMR
ncbi:MAG: phosphatidylinositol-specific phospholipase C/glycerophosphodiester phosphodiesterase family protein [Saprospiraceae bacterium]|nr:phosphatidylinositol-specific phospholipase C/glycerophosphodiester phosphodiesterase family protein [Saprospiraceae bacterium]